MMPMPFKLLWRATVASVTLTLLGAACAEPLAPRELAGTYALVTFNGLTPPQAASANVTVLSDTLLLTADGHGTWSSVRHIYPTTGPAQEFVQGSTPVTVARRGGNLWLRLEHSCDADTDCYLPEPTFVLLTPIGNDLYLGQSPHVFMLRRVAP